MTLTIYLETLEFLITKFLHIFQSPYRIQYNTKF